ncbi:MAG: hypothetical protein Q9170_007323 [Blastenia crenularia]
MSRTVADATRFTATSPYAYSKPSSILRSTATSSPSPFSASGSTPLSRRPPPPPPSSRNPNPSQPPTPPQNETPQQKVARLRALRAAEKLKPLGLWDRTVVRGRRWADVAHRTTALTLMGATVLAGLVTAFSLTDMILYNRNQRALFYAAQESIYTSTLRSAIAAEQESRPLTEEEISVLNREKMVLKAEAERERLKEMGWGKRVKGFLLREDVGREMRNGGEVLLGSAEGVGEEVLGGNEVQVPVQKVGDLVEPGRVMEVMEGKRRVEDRSIGEVHVAGGQLDRMAEEAVKVGTQKAKGGWSSWFGGSR